MGTRLKVQQIVEMLSDLNGAADQSDSTNSEEDSGADIEDLWQYGDRVASHGHVPPTSSHKLAMDVLVTLVVRWLAVRPARWLAV